MSFDPEIRALNDAYIELLRSGEIKTAEDYTSAFTRTRIREDGVARRILPAEPVTKDDFVPQLDHDQPVILVELEPDSPGAVVMPFGMNEPPAYYIKGKRYPVVMQRISSPMMYKDIMELETYRADIRQMLAELIVKDLSWAEDATFINCCNQLLGGSAGAQNVLSGVVQWKQLTGGVSRVNIGEAFKSTFVPKSRIPVKTILTNAAMLAELFKWQRDEVGGDIAQEVLTEGWGTRTLHGCDLIASIKRELIPDDTMFMFGDSRFIGKFYVHTEPVMELKKESDIIFFRAKEVVGMAIGHGDGVHRFDFVNS